MITSGAASLPGPGGEEVGSGLPDLGRFRVALRPAELPLPHPGDVHEAAHRASDLIHAGHPREARRLVEEFRRTPAAPADRFQLLRTALHGSLLIADSSQFREDAADLVSLLHRQRCSEQAAATLAVLLEQEPAAHGTTAQRTRAVDASARRRATEETVPASRGRRRGQAPQASAEMLVVMRALTRSSLAGTRAAATDPRRDAARLRAALSVLPEVRERMLVDPERELRLRFAQALEGAGDLAGATTAALDLLELIELEEVDADGPFSDPARTLTGAHAVLARTLGIKHPLQAVHHALEALEALHEIEDPPLRVGLITALLRALMAAGATAHASFTAGRLLSLQRSLGGDALRVEPLLAVATQRIQAERYDAARVPLEQARTIAREQRDQHGLLEAARLAASIHERTGEQAASLRELRILATAARRLADDLSTPGAARSELIRTELEANALVLRRALDLELLESVIAAARAIERRTRPDGGRPVLPTELLWDHRVDARVGLFIATGDALARGVTGVDEQDCEQRRREAMQVIDEMPPGHDARARYWATYLDDRHAHLLTARGELARARRAARRAREGWAQLGRDEDVTRLDALQEQLAQQEQLTGE
ncbi:hypothetical protein GCM10023160_27680 [Brachybacterium paraconglomeratum]|uniref:hypothetical protein n=1 Tax=Brachybacterium paraconglomeratum TaxID=173362 RepID=UPI0031E8751D